MPNVTTRVIILISTHVRKFPYVNTCTLKYHKMREIRNTDDFDWLIPWNLIDASLHQ